MNLVAIISFFVVTMLVVMISWYKTRKQKLESLSGFFFANRNFGFMVVGGALFFTNINAAQFIGENESVYTNNMSVMAWGMSSVFAMLIVSELIIPIYLKAGISTTPDFLGARYDASTKKLVSFIFLVSYLFNMLPSVLYSGAVAFNGLFNISGNLGIGYWETIWILVWTIGITGCLCSVFGGIGAIAISDVVLGICMFAGGLLLLFFGLTYLGKGSFPVGFQVLLSKRDRTL